MHLVLNANMETPIRCGKWETFLEAFQQELSKR